MDDFFLMCEFLCLSPRELSLLNLWNKFYYIILLWFTCPFSLGLYFIEEFLTCFFRFVYFVNKYFGFPLWWCCCFVCFLFYRRGTCFVYVNNGRERYPYLSCNWNTGWCCILASLSIWPYQNIHDFCFFFWSFCPKMYQLSPLAPMCIHCVSFRPLLLKVFGNSFFFYLVLDPHTTTLWFLHKELLGWDFV